MLFLELAASIEGIVGGVGEGPAELRLLALDVAHIADAAARRAGCRDAFHLLAGEFHHLGAVRVPAAAGRPGQHANKGLGAGNLGAKGKGYCNEKAFGQSFHWSFPANGSVSSKFVFQFKVHYEP